MTYVIAVLAAVIGVAGVVAGESDDSPGLQLLGVLLVLGALVGVVRSVRRRPSPVRGRPSRGRPR